MNLSNALQMGLASFSNSKTTIDKLTTSINEWEFWKSERKNPYRKSEVVKVLNSDAQTFRITDKSTVQLKSVHDRDQLPPLEMKAHYALAGFGSEQQTIKLDDRHIIKRFPETQVREFYSRALQGGKEHLLDEYCKSQFFLVYHYQKPASAIRGIPDIETLEQSRFVSFLRLLRTDSVEIPYCQHFAKKDDINEYQSFGMLLFNVRDYYKRDIIDNYRLFKSDVPLVRKLWKSYSSISFDYNKAFSVAVRRFNFSFQRVDWEDQIIDLMIAMEALFLSDNLELKHKLAMRACYFLRNMFPPAELFEFVKRAYNLRSKVVHGDTISPKDLGAQNMKAREFHLIKAAYVDRLREVLRSSIKLYILLYPNLAIREFIERVDDELIAGFGTKPQT